MIDRELQQFIEGPTMLVIGSVGADRLCTIGRASGARVVGPRAVELVLSFWQWPDTVRNLLDNPAISLTVVSPLDYTCYQIKGKASLHPATEADAALADCYIEATYKLLTGVGMPPTSTSAWFSNRELWLVSLTVSEVYNQTPGPLAGQRVGDA